ncbi:MAG: peptidylprolyl isomerase [Thiogranum sp.]
MQKPELSSLLRTVSAALLLIAPLALYTGSANGLAAGADAENSAGMKDDVIARVGDQPITFGQLNTMLNSSAIVGLSVPALGTTERNNVRVALLDKMISANLLYLDALQKGLDRDPGYRAEVTRFSEALLASLYRGKYLIGELEVSDDEVQEFFRTSIAPGTELTDEVRLGIEAALRKEKLRQRTATMRQRLREGVDLVISDGIMNASADDKRKDADVIASIDGETISWKQVRPVIEAIDRKDALMEAGIGIDTTKERFEALNKIFDNHIMARKAGTAGLEKDPVYRGRMAEFRKTRLINLHRGQLISSFEPDDEQINDWYTDNIDRIRSPESRKVQMVVLKTRDEAEQIKSRIESGELTIYQAARDNSIDPNAKKTLGQMGWVKKGSGFPELDRTTFALGPDELGGPVESPAGWHLVTVLDIRDAQNTDIDDPNTRKAARRALLHEKLGEYVVGLRRNRFSVAVYGDRLDHFFKEEADWVVSLNEKANQPGSLTEKRVGEMKKFMAQ